MNRVFNVREPGLATGHSHGDVIITRSGTFVNVNGQLEPMEQFLKRRLPPREPPLPEPLKPFHKQMYDGVAAARRKREGM